MKPAMIEADHVNGWPPAARGFHERAGKASWYLIRNRRAEVARRAMDIAVSLGLIFLTLPLMILVSLLIAMESDGPVLYRQVRVGQHGRHFVLFKFRSMVADAEESSGPCWAQKRDPRTTRIGRVIRMTRVDELPQLLNVLLSDMSMVGPRPERPHFAERLSALIPGYNERVSVKPGITGWAQVNYPYGASVHDARMKLSYDLHYVTNRTILLDLSILLRTVPVVLFGIGAR